MYVAYPKNAEEAKYHVGEMEQAGFHGCIASTDATHVSMNRCPISRANEHMGKKEGLPARTFNISVNHRRRILHTTRGHPARWNDKTLAIFDEFIMKVKNGIILSDYQFNLYETDEEDNIIEKSYNGCWILCDNGYQNWPVLMAPMKDANLFTDIRWSKWVESVRKDVECTFGIMKGRFRILKIGIRLQSIAAVDKLWCTCCALHNMLLEDDGLSEPWATGDIGCHDTNDITDTIYDASGMGYGNDRTEVNDNPNGRVEEENINVDNNDDNSNLVYKMNCYEFRQKLIDHFNILFEKNEIKWPTRNGNVEPSQI
jgi:hypothetical protein